MKIDEVKVKNFKSLKDVDLKLSNLTLITGVNSSGKSTFIQSLLLLKQNQETLKTISNSKIFEKSYAAKEQDKALFDAYNKILEDTKKLTFSFNGDYVELGNKKDILNQDTFLEDISFELIIQNNMSYKVFCSSSTALIKIESKVPMETLFNLFSEDFQYISTNRISPNITYPLSELNIEKNLIGIKGEYTAHYLAVNRHQSLKINKLIHPSSKTNQLLENVSLWLGEISNGIDISAKVYNELQQVNLTYNYIYGDNKSNEFTPLNVGFGITYVLPIIVAVLKSKPDDLLIIENPESHLHPAGQSKIAELCAIASSQGVQIIIETHSDHFLNGIRVATKKEILKPESSQIYYFRKEKNGLETKIDKLNIDKNGKIDEWPIGFFDEWDNKLDELLW